MKRQNYLFWDFNQLKNLIQSGELTSDKKYLILVHTASHSKDEVPALTAPLAELFPESDIVGTSAASVIYCGKLYSDRCLISFISTDRAEIKTSVINYEGKTAAELADEAAEKLIGYNTKAMLNFFADPFMDIADYVSALDSRYPDVKIAGGIADEPAPDVPAFVFTADGVYDKAFVAVSFGGNLITSSYTITGCMPLSDYHTVTKCHDTIIDEIDGIPAAEWFKDILGIDNFITSGPTADLENSILVRFPLVTVPSSAPMFVYYESSDNSIRLYSTSCPQNTRFRLSYQSTLSNAENSIAASRKIAETPCETLFVCTCILRETIFDNCAKRDLMPYIHAGACGALFRGEIGYSEGHSAYLNGTCSLLALAENENYIRVDNTVINDSEMLDKFDVIYENLLQRHTENVHNQSGELMKRIVSQEKLISRSVFEDSITGRDNLNKFIYDNRKGIFNKGCLVMIEKGDIAAGRLGADAFGSILKADIARMQKYINENYYSLECRIYVYNDYSFLITTDKDISNELFLAAAQNLFVNFGTIEMPEFRYSCVNHFMVVAGEQNMLDKIKLMKANSAKNTERFVIYDSAQGIEHAIEESMKTVALINYAIMNDTVTPYFQPIYDNQTGRIDKFEALMRLIGPDGKVYYPGQFLDAAKEYRLYLQMSKIMITKVFSLFEERDETVSINLSAYDINSPEIRGLIYEHLERIGNADHFIFEVLESEEFRDIEVLKKFIAKVRRHNVRIAIDDFGSGFTNLLEIAQLSPNYIKIDGQIVREVADSEMHRKIVGTILHLAKSFDIDLIAEYIENAELQNYASSHGVRYSQGYFFSQPVPYNQLDDVITSSECKVKV